ncbi:MAG: 30S ribosomal protein S17e [Candidatus Nitrosocaldaceae archaeon]|jgi:small subunit ribosomal protein S17e|nr:MAG: 30S ribosomal protein S17e [Candidatus Nitrosothermus koennekii]GIU71345.1 MAG: 30S ribosomal protein S17e [Candidatus Nitrosocaldaceae archaeon]
MNRIKRIAMQLIERYPDLFTTDFESNKEAVKKVAIFRSKELRNMVVGYITDYMKDKYAEKQEVSAEA